MSTTHTDKTADKPEEKEMLHTSGVQELIDRIRRDGVAKGHDEGESVVAAARAEAVHILDRANSEAEQILSAARTEAERLRKSAEDALRLAARDAVLALGEALRTDFLNKVQRLVSHTMQDHSFLQRLILEIARRAMPEDAGKSVEVLLPADAVTAEELQKSPHELAESSLSRFVLELSGDVLREGLTFVPAEDDRPGLRIQLKGEDVEIELTDEAVAGLLMEHLTPRFRALMEQPQRELNYVH
jgi:V/A-type H+-transporting ATPase subunit E